MYSAFFDNASVIPDGESISVGRVPLPFMHSVGDRAMLVEVAVAAAVCVVHRRPGPAQRVRPAAGGHERLARRLRHGRPELRAHQNDRLLLSAAMAGLGGVYYAGQQGGIGANDVQFIGSLTLLLFVAIWGIRTLTGALLGGMTAAALPVLQTHLPSSLADLTGLAAGIGIMCWPTSPTACSASRG